MTQQVDKNPEPMILSALHEVAGAAIVLDADLRVVAYTDDVPELVGGPVDLGIFAPQLLCGEGEQRPVAEALAEGRAVVAEVPRPTPEGGSRVILVRAAPLMAGSKRTGWILLLEGEPWESEGPASAVVVHGIRTRDSGMKKLLRDVDRVARRSASVLVRGETGTGKELVARAVHAASKRSEGPFRAVNCAALPPALLESALFGHVEGAFPGALRDEPGHFRLADSGTLFLDEVAELSLPLQAKLLRVLEERSVTPVGGHVAVPVDVRVVSTSPRSLRDAVASGAFRADLMYRLRVVPLFIPPLRERATDIELLAWHFIEARNDPAAREVGRIAPTALRAMATYPWPGNVRELENAVEYAFAMGDGPVLTEAHLPPEVRGQDTRRRPARNVPLEHDGEAGDDALPDEARRILYAIERAAGHRGRAAASLGMSRVTLWRKLERYGLLEDES